MRAEVIAEDIDIETVEAYFNTRLFGDIECSKKQEEAIALLERFEQALKRAPMSFLGEKGHEAYIVFVHHIAAMELSDTGVTIARFAYGRMRHVIRSIQ